MRALPLVLCLLALGCDPDVDCQDPPPVSYETFGAGFLRQHCQPCHASTSPDRHDAPEDVTFDTLEDIAWHRADMLRVAASGDPIMPPAGGVDEDDRVRLQTWLACDPADEL